MPRRKVTRRHSRIAFFISCCVLLSNTLAAKERDGELSVEITESSIRVSGLTQGSDALIFTASVSGYNGEPLYRRTLDVVSDSDGDGNVVYAPARLLSANTIVFAADLKSGRFGVRSRDAELREFIFDARNIVKDDKGDDVLVVPQNFVHAVAIRPNGDVWFESAFDGGALDLDGANGIIRVKTDRLKPTKAVNPKPFRPQAADVIFLVAPRTLEYAALRKSE